MARILRPTLLAVGLCLAGCSSASDAQTVLSEDVAGHRMLVKLESVEVTTTPFAHPVVSDEEQLAKKIEGLLAELAYGRPRGNKLFRLMEAPDRARLAAGLSRGLTSAGPHERLAFVLRIDDRGDVPWFTPDERLTRGIAYVDLEGRLHVAFDLIDDRVDYNDPDPYDPNERAQTRARIVSETGDDLGPAPDGKRRLGVAWNLVPPAPELGLAPAPPQAPSTAQAAKLELLEELLRDKIIDREEYERRRALLSSAD